MKTLFLSIMLLSLLTSSLFAEAKEQITLQLKWFHQFQFAGYYAAKEKGFYDDVGLDVTIKQRDTHYNNVEQVINNKAHYGISDSILMLYKARKEPVVIVAPIFQHSPSVLLSLQKDGINSPYQLDGKNIIFYPNDTDGIALLAMFKKLNIQPNLIRKRAKNDYKKLLNTTVDLIPSYLSNEPFYFKEKNIPINIINPTNYGFDFYGDMIFTSENEAKNHPKRVQKFKEASLKGWEYALENQEEIIQLIHTKYNTNKSIKHLRYEAKAIEQLITKDIIPLGTLDKGRFQYIFDLYEEYGLVDTKLNMQNFIFEEYIQHHSQIDFTKAEKEYLQNNPILTVQNLKSFPPFNFYEDNHPKGYSIDYINLIGQTLGVKMQFISDKSWKEYLMMLKKGEVDIIPQIAINEERKEFISYTDFKHIDYTVSLGTRKGSDIKSFDDLKDKTISLVNKSFLHTIFKENYPNQKLYLVGNIKEAVEAVSNGKADAIIANLATIEYYKNKNWLSNITIVTLDNIPFIPNKTSLHMGVQKENLLLKSILEKTDNALPYQEVLKLQRKWLDIDFTKKIQWNQEENSYLQNTKELRVCVNTQWLPFEQIHNNKLIGMTNDYIKIFEKNLPYPMTLHTTNSWSEKHKALQEDKCDFIPIMMKTKDSQKLFHFSKEIMNMPLVIATKQDKPFVSNIDNISSKRLGIVKGFAYIEILKEQHPNIQLIEVKDIEEGLSLVNKNNLYGFIGVLPAIGYNIQQNFVGSLKVAGKIDENLSFYMATNKNNPQLHLILDKLLDTVSPQVAQEIVNKWLSIKYEKSIDYTTIFSIIGVFFIILSIIIIKNRAINKVNLKVKEINYTLSKYINVIDTHVITSSTDLNRNITSVSQAFCAISGYTKKELLGKKHSIVSHSRSSKALFEDIWATLSSQKTWKGEIQNKKKNGEHYWVEATISPIFDIQNNITGYTSIQQDITDKKRIEEISITDELTGLFNKRHFNFIFRQEVNRALREKSFFGLMILDVDFFKQYNDFYGHQKGDFVLESIGKTLKTVCKRSSDIPFRIGGEEFGIIFTQASIAEAKLFTRHINKEIEAMRIEHKHNKTSDFITVSIGLYFERGGENLADTKTIYHAADTALYHSKENGRNQYTLSTPS